MMEETIVTYPPDWIMEAPPQTLADIWLTRYGSEWVRMQDIENDFNWVATRLLELGKMVVHKPAPDEENRFKIVGLER
jgi:hypothetical protein